MRIDYSKQNWISSTKSTDLEQKRKEEAELKAKEELEKARIALEKATPTQSKKK